MSIVLDQVSKRFGGNVVLDGFSCEVRKGDITALIGPNGAGKTTVFNVITGFLRPDEGSITVDGRSLVGLHPHDSVFANVVRNFQRTRLFAGLTVRENVMVACQGQLGESWLRGLLVAHKVYKQEKANQSWAMNCLEEVGLGSRWSDAVESLSYPEQKLVSLAQLLAANTDYLLLDEPAASLDSQSVQKMIAVIEKLRTSGKTVLVVEHNMQFIRELNGHVLFLHGGQLLAEGSFDEITSIPALSEVYFGTTHSPEVTNNGS